MRLSEPQPQFYQDADLMAIFNEAQDFTAMKLSSRTSVWSGTEYIQLPVVSGSEWYLGPENMLYPRAVAHYKEGYPRPNKLLKGDIQSLRLNTAEDIGANWYTHYEFGNKGSGYVEYGVVETASANTILDSRSDFGGVRVGDILFNITDGSTATIKSFEAGNPVVDDWVGGSSQYLNAGDEYRIRTRERNRYLIDVWPTLNFDSPDFKASGSTPTNFTVTEDAVITQIRLRFATLPVTWWEDDDRLNVFIETTDGMLAQSSPESVYSRIRVRTGWNTINVPPELRLKQNTNYRIRAVGISATIPYNFEIADFELKQLSDDFLRVAFVPKPSPMINLDSITEFDNHVVTVILIFAKMKALELRNPQDPTLNALMNEYEYGINEIKEYMTTRDEDTIDYVGQHAYTDLNNTADVTHIYGDLIL